MVVGSFNFTATGLTTLATGRGPINLGANFPHSDLSGKSRVDNQTDDENVIKINKNKLIQRVSEHIIHERLQEHSLNQMALLDVHVRLPSSTHLPP